MGRIKRREPIGSTARKMPLRNAESAKDTYSSVASAIVRQLALGGIALVWLIKIGKPEAAGIKWHSDLVLPLGLFAFALLMDLLQYCWGTVAWARVFANAEAENKGLDDLISPPTWINKITFTFFTLKIVSVICSYIYLLLYMSQALIGQGQS